MLKTLIYRATIIPRAEKIKIIILAIFIVLLPFITFAKEPVNDLNKQSVEDLNKEGVQHFGFHEQQLYLDDLREKEQSDSVFLNEIISVAVIGGLLTTGAIGFYFCVLKKKK